MTEAEVAPRREADDVAWHTLPAEDVAARLDAPAGGLTSEEAAKRLEQYGPNEVEAERPTPWWRILAHQFLDPLIYILLVAAAVTFALGDLTDFSVILAVVMINAAIGFIQELRATRAIQALAQMAAPHAEVLRDGSTVELVSRELVPGDVVLLTSGTRVPADVRFLRVRDLEADESALTGESAPVRKTVDALEAENLVAGDQTNMAFAGTIVTRGRGRGVVVRTGAATELGRIATRMREVGEEETPLQHKIHVLGRWIGLVVLGLTMLVVLIGWLQGLAVGEILVTAVALAVATIPEGLPVVVTVTLAVGVRRMARRNAIIRSLPAVETLGSATVIGSDKTGTLTLNEMTVRTIWLAGRRYDVTEDGIALDGEAVALDDAPGVRTALLAGVLANEAEPARGESDRRQGDPTEVALLIAAERTGLDPVGLHRDRAEVDLLPFEPERRFMASLNEGGDGRTLWVKGAPEAVLDRCADQLGANGQIEALDAEAIRRAAAALANEGFRVLATAFRREDAGRIDENAIDDLVFAGLHGMEDPVRPEAVEAVAAARKAGLRVLMLTGDHVDTARAIGRQLGLAGDEEHALEGAALALLDDDELDRRLASVDIYARVAPEHKLRIVQRLKAAGETVAVTGDGVNDAPALRAAHLGVAMGKGGTDVAREASDMVLADDNFATITAAVEEGRIVFANLRKVTFFLLSTGVGMPLTILAALIVGWPLPLLAAQVLWINLVTNGLQDVALAFEPGEPGLLDRPPRRHGEGVLSLALLGRLVPVGVILAAGTLAVFWWVLDTTNDVDLARSAAMTQMVVFQFFHVLNSRSLDRSILSVPPFSNRFLFVSLIAAALAQLAVLYLPPLQGIFRTAPPSAEQWAVIVLVGSTVVIGGEIDKWRNRRRHRFLG